MPIAEPIAQLLLTLLPDGDGGSVACSSKRGQSCAGPVMIHQMVFSSRCLDVVENLVWGVQRVYMWLASQE